MSRVDWFRVLADLQAFAGLNRAAVSRQLRLSESSLKAYYRGQHEPNHRDGERIVELWVARCGRQRSDLPRQQDEPLSAARVR